jgi:primosomal protein N' (replication factor Y)
VGVLDADVALHLPDFRAGERTYQLLVQVAGRAGRGAEPGEVLVQTCTPEHPAIAAAVLHDERAFLDRELQLRRDAAYPPYARLATVLFSGRVENEVENLAARVAGAIRPAAESQKVKVLGPAPQALARLRNQYRWHIVIKAGNAPALRETLQAALAAAEADTNKKSVRVIVDVDPVEVL